MTFLKISLSFVPVLHVIRTPGGDLSLNLCPFQGGLGGLLLPIISSHLFLVLGLSFRNPGGFRLGLSSFPHRPPTTTTKIAGLRKRT